MTRPTVVSTLNFIAVMILVCLGATPAAAQLTTPDQPVVTAQPPAARHTERELTVSGSTFGGYDSDVTEGTSVGAGVQSGAPQLGGSFSMHYSARAERVSFFSDASINPTHYQAFKPITGYSAFGSASTSVAITRKMRVNGGARINYLPLFHFSVLPEIPSAVDQPPVPSIDYMLTALDGIAYRASVGWEYDLPSRSKLHANYSRGSFKYLAQDYNLKDQSLGGGYSRGLTKYATLRLGYAEQRADYPVEPGGIPERLRYQTIDVGIDYSRPLSRTRRTTVGFGTGSTRVNYSGEVFYDVIGHASIQHQVRRTWNLGATYSRGLELVGGFTAPFFADSVALNLSGYTSRRVKLTGSTGYANGSLGLGSKANGYGVAQGSSTRGCRFVTAHGVQQLLLLQLFVRSQHRPSRRRIA